jgi:hypothetical protein
MQAMESSVGSLSHWQPFKSGNFWHVPAGASNVLNVFAKQVNMRHSHISQFGQTGVNLH